MTRSIALVLGLLFLIAGFMSCCEVADAADMPIYADNLSSGWQNWSWNTGLNFSNASPVHGGAYSLSVTYNAAWAGLYLHADTTVDLSGYDHISFWINGGSGSRNLQVVANGDGGNAFPVAAQANSWTQVNVPLTSLGNPAALSDLYWQDTTGGVQPTFYLDDITLVARTGPQPPPPPPGTGPSLSIDANSGRHSISDGIYGMNFSDEPLAAELRLPVRRWGGNSTSRYNWQNDTYNTGSDWYFENIRQDNPNPSTLPDGSAADRFVEQDRRTGTKTLMTVPLIGWVAKRRLENHPYDCGFGVAKYGTQQSVDSWDTNCGNGVHSNGSNVTGNDPGDTSVPISPDFITGWMNHLTGKYGTAAGGGVAYFNLDNEPMLWDSTHRDIHPLPTTYDELRDRSYQYASAIKAADPSAKTLGPVLWGWCAYFYSALDGCGVGGDYQAHGNTPFVVWYLQQMEAYEQQHGVRIVDYLDLHYYPAANGVSLSPAGNSATQALRLRSTRSLWDPSYVDESWISDLATGGIAVRIIPRMKDWVNTAYPGTKLAITEYNWGALDHINGALAQADVLGIFGREGLDLATLWGPPTASQPGAFAFRMYRNYDALGHGFGDTSIKAESSDQGQLSVYAALRSADNALTVIVVNKTASSLVSTVNLSGFALSGPASVYQYSAANLGAIEHAADQPVSSNGFSATFPGNSITLLIMKSGVTGETLMITKSGTGSGSVSPNKGTIDWNGNIGTGTYTHDEAATLTATADAGSTFSGWTGCDSTSGNTCTVTMNASKAVTATFGACSYSISPTLRLMTRVGGVATVNVSASAGCNWTAVSNASWITILSGSSGTGNGTVKYSVSRKSTPSNRTGTVTIAGHTFTVLQDR